MSRNGESSFVEIGIGTFGGCFINTSRKIFPMMFRIVESSFVEIGIGTFGGCFINMGDEPRKIFPMMSRNGESSL
jgi:hypothetical protein